MAGRSLEAVSGAASGGPSLPTPAAPASGRSRARVSGVAARLTAANVLGAATGFITGPLLARTLGASGRGDLAAVTVPLTLLPGVVCLGLPAFPYRAIPRGRPVREVLGSLGLPLLILGSLVACCSMPLAGALAGDRPEVRLLLVTVFLCTPVFAIGSLLGSCLAAGERWNLLIVMILLPFGVPFLSIVVLTILGDLTLGSAAIATIVGSLLAVIPGLVLLRDGVPRFRLTVTRQAFSFGIRSWLGGLARTANTRLDQFLMITVVAPRELGLYAVATTFAGASNIAAGALGPPLMTRVSGGDIHLMPRAVRTMLAGTAILNIGLALVAPFLLRLLFGSAFVKAVPMAMILLVAQIPCAAADVLGSALQADGDPTAPSVAEGIALTITVGGLLLFLRPFGGIGAAVVSLAAYSASFSFQLHKALRRTKLPLGSFVRPTRSDAAWLMHRAGEVCSVLRRVRSK